MKAIVLAGGFGTRIQPLTNSIPKPMLPILNRPMMEHIILKLRDELGITEIGVLLFFKPEIIRDHFRDGSDLGINITYFQPDDDYGTAGAVAFAREFLDETFIIVSGDLVTDFDLKGIQAFHKQKNSKLTITLTPVENPLQFGVVIANEETNRIEKFLEKPSWGEVFSDTINTGIYVIEPEILDYIPFKENFDFAKDLFPKLMKKDIPLWGCPMGGYWRDVGNPASYRDVYHDIFKEEIKLNFKGTMSLLDEGVIYHEEEIELPQKIRIKGIVVLGKNVTIEEGVTLQNCSLGDNVVIRRHSEVINSVLWDNVYVGIKTKLSNSVICNDVVFEDEVKVAFGVIIAEKCLIQNKVSFEKDITMWPDKIVEASSVVSTNIIWGNKYKSSIFENGAVVGRTNIELSCQISTKLAESLGSTLPVGSYVCLSRDYQRSSRMLAGTFLSGLQSTGINVVDLPNVPSNVMRYCLSKDEKIMAGVHFRRSVNNPMNSEIVVYTEDGLEIDTHAAQSIERIFFRENFRRVNYDEIGDILDKKEVKERYIKAVEERFDKNLFRRNDFRIAVDMMNGSSVDTYPEIINTLGIENIIVNAYKSDTVSADIKKSQENVGNIVRSMGLNCGLLIYPNGHKLQLVNIRGELVYDYKLLLIVLHLLDISTDKRLKVLLPAWAPDFIEYNNLDITRTKISSLKTDKLRGYDFIADTDGHFAFCEFSLNKDSVFASLRILELAIRANTKFIHIIEKLPKFHFKGRNIPCPSELKGKMMRKFLEDGKDKRTSSEDGVKIWVSEDEWILMVPDQHSEFLNLYIQARNEDSGGRIYYQYCDKIEKWINE